MTKDLGEIESSINEFHKLFSIKIPLDCVVVQHVERKQYFYLINSFKHIHKDLRSSRFGWI